MKAHFEMLAAYGRWANEQLYAATAALSQDELHAPRAGFFPSIAKTLNHLLVGDTIWLGRLTGKGSPGVTALDQVLHLEFAALERARRAADEELLAFVAGLPEARFRDDLSYRSVGGVPQVTPIGLILTHVFNHGTHHRGQAHAMLSGTAIPPPPLDLIFFFRAHPPPRPSA